MPDEILTNKVDGKGTSIAFTNGTHGYRVVIARSDGSVDAQSVRNKGHALQVISEIVDGQFKVEEEIAVASQEEMFFCSECQHSHKFDSQIGQSHIQFQSS